MRTVSKILSIVLLTACAVGCTVDKTESPTGTATPVTVGLQFATNAGSEIEVTRATANENYLEELRVYIFNTDGRLTGYTKLTAGTQSLPTTTGTVDVETVTGESYVYAVANAATSQYYLSSADRTLLDVTDVRTSTLTRSQFLAAVFERQSMSLNPLDNRFLMSGYANEGNSVTIGQSGITSPTGDGRIIKLYRVLSKNRFTFSVNNSSTKNFTLKSYTIYNIATSGKLVADNQPTTSSVENLNPVTVVNADNSVEFYLPENRRATSNAITIWKDREKDSYTGDLRSFVNAPSAATYIVFSGEYNEANISADVTYTIHLGNFGSSGALNDFNVVRNHNYTYNIVVKGVDDIKVEAQIEGDNPYAEGIVINYSAGKAFLLDAHYEARVMQFKQKDIKALKDAGKGYIVRIVTAFGQTDNLIVKSDGVYDTNGELLTTIASDGTLTNESAVFAGEADYGWIEFVKNDGKSYNSGGNLVNSSHTVADVCRYPGTTSASIKSIFEAMTELYSHADDTDGTYFNQGTGTERYVYFTCFVDENYYPQKSWGDYVNLDANRRIFMANDLYVSTDTHSIYANVQYSISQRPIWTFYNTAASETLVAYGTESVSEDRETFSSTTYDITSQQNWNGLSAAVAYQNGKSFYTNNVRQTGDYEYQQDRYSKVTQACMSRNRDLDGNGTIDANEIRWYVTTIGQCVGLWIGEEILPAEARLFDYTLLTTSFPYGNNVSKYHFFTASSNNTLWAEEGISAGSSKQSTSVRCVRTLRSGTTASPNYGLTNPVTYYDYANHKVDFAKIDSRVFRTSQSTAMATHNEHDQQNKIYSSFEIKSSNLPYDDSDQTNIIYAWPYSSMQRYHNTSAVDECYKKYGEGWRVPNQRELAVMTLITDSTDDWLPSGIGLWSSTDFTGAQTGYYRAYGSSNPSYGFQAAGGGRFITIGSSGSIIRVRCVRDNVTTTP